MKETKGRSEGKAESYADASLDEVLDAIESRLESLVDVVKGLSEENARLKADLLSARETSEKNSGAAAALAKHEADRAAVRARIERLLKRRRIGVAAQMEGPAEHLAEVRQVGVGARNAHAHELPADVRHGDLLNFLTLSLLADDLHDVHRR